MLPFLAVEHDLVILTDDRRPTPQSPGRVVPLSGIGRLPEAAWLQMSTSRWLRANPMLFHGTYNTVPIANRNPAVVTIHDLSWEHHPEDHTAGRRVAFQIQGRWSARHARAIITVSQFIRERIVDAYNVPPERIFVAPNPLDPAFGPERADPATKDRLARAGVGDRYVVALGGARRRGIDVTLAAWTLLKRNRDLDDLSLVVVGEAQVPPARGVVGLGRVDDPTWVSVLAGATAFCYPTRYEGFGLPALEAAASGVPVVCARVASLPEVLGPAAEWCDTPGTEDIASGLERVLTDAARQEELRRAGMERAAASPDARAAAAIISDAYRFALS